jgi:hypothetical protein
VSPFDEKKTPAKPLLACNGIAAIWKLHVAAAEAHEAGYSSAATSILKIAETAEAARILDKHTAYPMRGVWDPRSVLGLKHVSTIEAWWFSGSDFSAGFQPPYTRFDRGRYSHGQF